MSSKWHLCPGYSQIDIPGPDLSPEFQPPASRGQLLSQSGSWKTTSPCPTPHHRPGPHSLWPYSCLWPWLLWPLAAQVERPGPSLDSRLSHFPHWTIRTFMTHSSQYIQNPTASCHTCGYHPGPWGHQLSPGFLRALPVSTVAPWPGFLPTAAEGNLRHLQSGRHPPLFKTPQWACPIPLLRVKAAPLCWPLTLAPSAPHPFLPSPSHASLLAIPETYWHAPA